MESMMFTWGEPLEAKMAADVFNITKEEAYECFKELQAEYEQEGRGIVIREVNKAFQFVTREENADYVRRLCTPVKAKKLSQSALEVLAIIAYKQPVTKGEMEAIRGIKCDRVVEGLMNKNLIEEVGALFRNRKADSLRDNGHFPQKLWLYEPQGTSGHRGHRKRNQRRHRSGNFR